MRTETKRISRTVLLYGTEHVVPTIPTSNVPMFEGIERRPLWPFTPEVGCRFVQRSAMGQGVNMICIGFITVSFVYTFVHSLSQLYRLTFDLSNQID